MWTIFIGSWKFWTILYHLFIFSLLQHKSAVFFYISVNYSVRWLIVRLFYSTTSFTKINAKLYQNFVQFLLETKENLCAIITWFSCKIFWLETLNDTQLYLCSRASNPFATHRLQANRRIRNIVNHQQI